MLSVINNLRHTDVGIPITFQQYQKSGADALVERLVNRHLHFLACRVCEFLKMKPNRVLVHWACCKVPDLPLVDSMLTGWCLGW